MSIGLAERVAELPQLYETGSRSTANLLRDIGFIDQPQALRVDELASVLERKPQLAGLWLNRGSDQRIAGGWSIERENGKYRVQNYSNGQHMWESDRAKACAEFIVGYVCFIRDVLSRSADRRENQH